MTLSNNNKDIVVVADNLSDLADCGAWTISSAEGEAEKKKKGSWIQLMMLAPLEAVVL